METLILASRSPRRSELLALSGIPFEVLDVNVDESCSLPAAEAVSVLSARKALAAGRLRPGKTVLAADTLVSLEGRSLGKPRDEEEAAAMLRALSGKTHQVFTGVSVLAPSGALLTETDRSDVTFCSLTEDEILSYVRSGEPMDKAGAYACQGRAAFWITRLEGSHTSVIGLPLARVREMLLRVGFPLIPGL